jgi:hypothetical protein
MSCIQERVKVTPLPAGPGEIKAAGLDVTEAEPAVSLARGAEVIYHLCAALYNILCLGILCSNLSK